MSRSEKVLSLYEELLAELEMGRPTGEWKAKRQLVNTMLRSLEVHIDYDDARTEFGAEPESGLTGFDRKNTRKAIEMRRKIYRMMKKHKRRGVIF